MAIHIHMAISGIGSVSTVVMEGNSESMTVVTCGNSLKCMGMRCVVIVERVTDYKPLLFYNTINAEFSSFALISLSSNSSSLPSSML
jgi:hypothetical protein